MPRPGSAIWCATAAATSIKNHLRAVAEKNLEIIQAVYQEFERGKITEHEAKDLCRKILFSQTIGDRTDIFFCANAGIAAEHPNPGDRQAVHGPVVCPGNDLHENRVPGI